jgi:hypothetical protein
VPYIGMCAMLQSAMCADADLNTAMLVYPLPGFAVLA